MPLFRARIVLEDLAVHPKLLCHGNENLSVVTYIQRMLTLNKSSLLMLHTLEQFVIGVLAAYSMTTASPRLKFRRIVWYFIFSPLNLPTGCHDI